MNPLFIYLLFISTCSAFIKTPIDIIGTYNLRYTNDKKIRTKFAYLVITPDNNIKLKTIIEQNNLLATKISKTGRIEYLLNFPNIVSFIFGIRKYEIIVRFNNVNKYSYSFLGIEYPEFRYKQISNYNNELRLIVFHTNNSIYVDESNGNFYLFDLCSNLGINRLPYVETPFNTLIITQIISFLINLILLKVGGT